MAKKFLLELTVRDEGSTVKAALSDGKGLLLDYENTDAKQVRVRSPLPDRGSFISKHEEFVSMGLHESVEKSVAFYVSCREKAVFKEIQEVRKAMKRISREMECVLIAKEELAKNVREKT